MRSQWIIQSLTLIGFQGSEISPSENHNGRIFKYAVSLDATEEQLRLADYELDILNRYLYDNSRDFKNNIDDEIGILKDFGVEFEVIR